MIKPTTQHQNAEQPESVENLGQCLIMSIRTELRQVRYVLLRSRCHIHHFPLNDRTG